MARDLRTTAHLQIVSFVPPQAELKDYLEAFGRRTATGRSQARLAAALGLNRAYVVSMEHGRQNITVGVVLEIANALGVSPLAAGRLLDPAHCGSLDDLDSGRVPADERSPLCSRVTSITEKEAYER